MKKILLPSLLIASILNLQSTVHATEKIVEVDTTNLVGIHQEIDEINSDFVHELTEDMTRGADKPGFFASTHHLSTSGYNYQLTNFGYRLYTDKWVTTDSGKISVSLQDWTCINNYSSADKTRITFALYSSSGLVRSTTTNTVNGKASATWTGLENGKKYYVMFEVPTTGNRFSGNGTISA